MIRNCVLMLDILLPKHIPNRPHVWNINMFPNNDPSITLAYMHNYSCVHAYAHCCIAQEDTLYTSYIDWKQVTYCSFSQIRKPGLFNPVQIFNPQISTMTSKYHQQISPAHLQYPAGHSRASRSSPTTSCRWLPPPPTRRATSRSARRGKGVGHRWGRSTAVVFFWEVGQKWRIQKTWKSWKKFEKTGKERWLFWIYWLIMTVYWIEAVSKW